MAGVTGDTYFRGGIPQSRYCGGCAHYQRLCASDSHSVSGARVCLYILDMNHSRGCAAGATAATTSTPGGPGTMTVSARTPMPGRAPNTARTVERRCVSGRRNNHAETSKASALRPVMQRVYPRVGVRYAMRREPDGARQCGALRLL